MTAPIQISGGNYPLIQQPNPFQELAATIQGIQQEHQARIMQQLQRQQLMAGIQHLAAQTSLANAQAGEAPSRIAANQASADEAASLSHLHQTQDKEAQTTATQQHETRMQTQMGMGPINTAIQKGVRPGSARWNFILGDALRRVDDPAAQLAISKKAEDFSNEFGRQQMQATNAAHQASMVDLDRQRLDLERQRLLQAGNKEPNAVERLAGNQAESAQQSLDSMKEIATRNPAAAQEALRIINSREAPWKMGSIIQMFRGTGSQDAQNFVSHYGNFQLSTVPAYGGTRPTAVTMGLSNLADIPGIGATNFDVPFANAQRRIEDLRAKAGRAARPLATRGPGSGTQAAAPSGAPRNFNQFLATP